MLVGWSCYLIRTNRPRYDVCVWWDVKPYSTGKTCIVYVILQRVGSNIDRARATVIDGYRRAIPSVQHRYSQYNVHRSLHTVRNECKLTLNDLLKCMRYFFVDYTVYTLRAMCTLFINDVVVTDNVVQTFVLSRCRLLLSTLTARQLSRGQSCLLQF